MFQDPVMSRLDDEQILLVIADRDSIGEIDAVHDYFRLLSSRRILQDAPVPAVLQDIEQARLV